MTLRFYLVPAVPCVRAGEEIPNSRCPKYIAAAAGLTWGAMDYGAEPLFLVLADVTAPQHTQLTGRGDVRHICRYDQRFQLITSEEAGVITNGLEALNIPGNWVAQGWPSGVIMWTHILRFVAGCFQLSQRVHGISGRTVFREGVDLSRTVSSLPAGILQDLQDAADSFGWDYSTVTGSWTIRQVLVHLAHQWLDAPFSMAGMSF